MHPLRGGGGDRSGDVRIMPHCPEKRKGEASFMAAAPAHGRTCLDILA